jgi:hypothetical protein
MYPSSSGSRRNLVLAATVHDNLRTATTLLPLAAAAAPLTFAPAAGAASGPWSKAQGFDAKGDRADRARRRRDAAARRHVRRAGRAKEPVVENHLNSANRDRRTAGRYAIFT